MQGHWIRIGNGWQARGWARRKARDNYFFFLFQQSGVSGLGLALAGKPGVGKTKGKILKLLISCFLFSSPGSPDEDYHQLAS